MAETFLPVGGLKGALWDTVFVQLFDHISYSCDMVTELQ